MERNFKLSLSPDEAVFLRTLLEQNEELVHPRDRNLLRGIQAELLCAAFDNLAAAPGPTMVEEILEEA